jgi:sterol desaturase/sphingolipid hydroxylase (fatty acid hydroxylase superfamily)
MKEYWEIWSTTYQEYGTYFWNELTHIHAQNYFYGILLLSLFVWGLEVLFPWNKKQGVFRRDFWLDGFYAVFHFFLFPLLGFKAIEKLVYTIWQDAAGETLGMVLPLVSISQWPFWLQLLVLFILTDFIQWNIHRLLHRVSFLWEFHKVHHSAKYMGFATHMRFHWVETVVYKSLQFIPLSLVGFSATNFFVVHLISIGIGHLNHSNIRWSYGLIGFLVNNPYMHRWHHQKKIAAKHPHGVNFGISLSVWDYLFKTAYIPTDGENIELGFEGEDALPKNFVGQLFYPLLKKK